MSSVSRRRRNPPPCHDVRGLARGLLGHVARSTRLAPRCRARAGHSALAGARARTRPSTRRAGRRRRRVHLETGHVDAEGQQRAHGLLHVVADDRPGQHGVRASWPPTPCEQVTGDHHAQPGRLAVDGQDQQADQVAASGMPFQRAAIGQAAGAELGQLLVASPAVAGRATSSSSRAGSGAAAGSALARRRAVGTPKVARRRPLRRLAERARLEQLLDPVPDRLHLVAVERGLGTGAVPATEGQLRHVDVEGHVADERDDAGVRAGQARSLAARFSRSFGVCSSRWEKMPSRSPYLVSSLAAVFSPTPGHRAGCRTGHRAARPAARTCDGGTPVRSKMPASS